MNTAPDTSTQTEASLALERLLQQEQEKTNRLTRDRVEQLSREARGVQSLLDASNRLTQTLSSFSGVMSSLFSGNLLGTAQSIAAMLQRFATVAPPGATPSTAGAAVTAASRSAMTAASGDAAVSAGAAGGMAQIAAAAGPVAAALAGVAAAAGAAYGTLTRLASAASPQISGALSQAMQYLTASIGMALAPMLVPLGTAIIFVSDLIRELSMVLIDLTAQADRSNTTWERANISLIKTMTGFDSLDQAAKMLGSALLRLVAAIGEVVASLADRLGLKGLASESRKSAEVAREASKKYAEAATPTEELGKAFAGTIDRMGGGRMGSEMNQRMASAMRDFIDTARMMGQQARYENVTDSYKRIQQFVVGNTTLQQKMIDIQQRILQVLEKSLLSADERRIAAYAEIGPPLIP